MELSGLRHASSILPSGETIGTHRIGCWMGHKVCLDVSEKTKIVISVLSRQSSLVNKPLAQPKLKLVIIFGVTVRPNAGHGLLILEVSRSHTTFGRTPLDT